MESTAPTEAESEATQPHIAAPSDNRSSGPASRLHTASNHTRVIHQEKTLAQHQQHQKDVQRALLAGLRDYRLVVGDPDSFAFAASRDLADGAISQTVSFTIITLLHFPCDV